MATTKNYKFGKYTFKAYYRTSGHGWEVGLACGSKYYFVGNFIREKDAKKWWSMFNKNITTFARNNEFFSEAPKEFYGEFLGTFLYKEYYTFLSNLFEGYNTFYAKGFEKYNAKWAKYSRNWAA